MASIRAAVNDFTSRQSAALTGALTKLGDAARSGQGAVAAFGPRVAARSSEAGDALRVNLSSKTPCKPSRTFLHVPKITSVGNVPSSPPALSLLAAQRLCCSLISWFL